MSGRLRNVDRDTPMLMPVDLRDWIPEEHMVNFIVDAISTLSLRGFRLNERGSGSEQYLPSMMAALLIYCYATGRMSSREIEAATHSDIAVRYICGGDHHPDHDTICTFRRENRALFSDCFVKVLALATELGRLKKGKQTVEPVFGIIKEVIGFRQFHLRGHPHVQTEWTLVTLAYNMKRLFNMAGRCTMPAKDRISAYQL